MITIKLKNFLSNVKKKLTITHYPVNIVQQVFMLSISVVFLVLLKQALFPSKHQTPTFPSEELKDYANMQNLSPTGKLPITLTKDY